ncbi:oxygen-independent coproporphyrinogen III oxidase [candidate division GN15 bacterium]|nr:oxygen-independent coproporphyrinogen III oxidase [candidate division GN15 bacterium]
MTSGSHNRNDDTVTVELLQRYDRPGPRYTSYPTVPMWSDAVGAEAYREALRNASVRTDEPVALYVHIPFCRSRCFYCGCNTCVTQDMEAPRNYLDLVYRECEEVSRLLGDRRGIGQLHFGGGTPTYIGVEGLTKVLAKLRSHFDLLPRCEMSIEVDPRTAGRRAVMELRQLGFNRVSFGVQDFDPDVQKAIGRFQSTDRVREVLNAAREADYAGINFDLIYGLPQQTPESFAQTLTTTIEMHPDRIALYSFAYLPRLRPNQTSIKEEELPDTQTKFQLFSDAIRELTNAGYRQIGMDHFALPQDELSRAQEDGRLHRNFMGYTVQAAQEMVGIGMSAIGYIDNTFVQNASSLEAYQSAIETEGLAVYRGLKLSRDDVVRRYVISELMCNFAMVYDQLESRLDVNYEDYFASEDERLEPFIEDGLLRRDAEGLKVTPIGRTFVRNIAMAFDAYLKDPSRGGTFSRTI